MDAVSKSLRLPRETYFEPQKVVRDPGVLTLLASKSLSCHSGVQILRILISKGRLNMPVFKDFDFRMALAPQRGANFTDLELKKCSEPASF